MAASDDPRRDTVTRLWTEGLTYTQIAAQLNDGSSRCAVAGLVRRLGLPKRKETHPLDLRRPRKKKGKAKTKGRRAPNRPAWSGPSLPVEPTPEPTPREEDQARVPNVLALSPGQCKWPVGTPKTPEFGFCGAPAGPGKSYCPGHHARAYVS